MAKEQKPAVVHTVEEQEGRVGKPEETVLKGSRLAQIMGQGGPMGHPEDKKEAAVSPSQLHQMMQGKRQVHRFKWPGTDVDCGIVILTEQELEEASAWASKRMEPFKDVMDHTNFQLQWTQEQTHQILWRALVDPETMYPWAASPDELRGHLTRELSHYLGNKYEEWERVVSPLAAPVTTIEQADRIIEALKKEPEETELGDYDAASLRLLLKRMAYRSQA